MMHGLMKPLLNMRYPLVCFFSFFQANKTIENRLLRL